MDLNRSSSGRQKSSITSFFSYNLEDNKATCRIQSCKYSCKIHTGNQTRHVQTVHPKIYRQYRAEIEDATCRSKPPVDNPNVQKPEARLLHHVPLSKPKIIEAILQLVTVNGRSFSLFNDSGMRMLLNPLLNSLPCKDRMSVTPETVKMLVHNRADLIKQMIKGEIQEKRIVSVKLDIATIHKRSFLALNIQLISKGELIIRTLKVVEITGKYSSKELKDFILNIFKSYDMSVSNVYSLVYAADMCKYGIPASTIFEEKEDFIAVKSEELNATKQEPISDLVFEMDNEDTLVIMDVDNMEAETNTVDQIMQSLEICCHHIMSSCDSIINVQCFAHVLDAAITSAIKKSNLEGLISRARKAVKYFGNNIILNAIREQQPDIEKPGLDIPTSWQSTYDMFSMLLCFKDFSSPIPYLTQEHWLDIQNCVEVLTPANMAANKFNLEQMLMPEFYCALLLCIEETEKFGTVLAENIIEAIKEAGTVLLQNEVLLAGIFLDPLVNATLDQEQKGIAINHLCQVWMRLNHISAQNEVKSEPLDTQENESETYQTNSQNATGSKKLASVITDALYRKKRARLEQNETDITLALEHFYNEQERNTNVGLLEYWEWNKYIIPEIYQIAIVVLATPATKASIERVFSGLDYICSDSNKSLSNETLDSILTVRTNYDTRSNNAPTISKNK